MADPVTFLGTAGAVANIIGIIGATISTIRELYQHWDDADFTYLNLVVQLTALQAAVTKIQEWSDRDLDDQHFQLKMNLELSLTGCKVLATKLHDFIAKCQTQPDELPATSGKIRLVLGSSQVEEVQKSIERLTSALNLLLNACNCMTLSEQKLLLEKKSTRKVMLQVRKDTESLIEHRDDNSSLTRCTDRLSKLSIVFPFDHELFSTAVYGRTLASLRDPVKDALRKQHTDTAKARTKSIDRTLKQDARVERRQIKVLLLGDTDSGKETLIKQLQMNYPVQSSLQERAVYRRKVLEDVVHSAKGLAASIKQSGTAAEVDRYRELCVVIDEFSLDFDVEAPLGTRFQSAVEGLWNNERVPKCVERFEEFGMVESSSYYFDHIGRIAAQDYIPTDIDVSRAKMNSTGMREIELQYHPAYSIRMFDVPHRNSAIKKWMDYLDGIRLILLVVNLASYDLGTKEDSEENKMMVTLNNFEEIAKSGKVANTTIAFLFCNQDMFREKLNSLPLEMYVSHYKGDTDLDNVVSYIIQCFQLGRRSSVHHHVTQSFDTKSASFVVAAAKQAERDYNMKMCGLI